MGYKYQRTATSTFIAVTKATRTFILTICRLYKIVGRYYRRVITILKGFKCSQSAVLLTGSCRSIMVIRERNYNQANFTMEVGWMSMTLKRDFMIRNWRGGGCRIPLH